MRQTEAVIRTERTTLIYQVATVLAMGGSTAMAADSWAGLAPLANNSGSPYLDKDSIERNTNNTVCVTTRDAYGAPRKLSGSKMYQYNTRTSVYDCKEGRTLPVNVLIQNGQHDTVLVKTINDPRWEAVVPRSGGEAILRAACQE